MSYVDTLTNSVKPHRQTFHRLTPFANLLVLVNQVLSFIPNFIAAVAILGIAYYPPLP